MASVKIDDVVKWLDTADKVFQTPMVREVLLPMVKGLLPQVGVTPEQAAQLDAHYADLARRRERARARAGQ